MRGSISLDSVYALETMGGRRYWRVACGECVGRRAMYEAGGRETKDYALPWEATSEAKAWESLARHDKKHHG